MLSLCFYYASGMLLLWYMGGTRTLYGGRILGLWWE